MKNNKESSKKETSSKGKIFFGMALIAIYAALFHFLLWPGFKLSLDSKNWPTVKGQIESAEVLYHNGQTYRSEELWQNLGRHSDDDEWRFHVYVKYSYAVGQDEFVSDQVCLRLGNSDKIKTVYEGSNLRRAKRIAQEYAQMKTPNVFFNPDNHSMAVLKAGASLSSWALQLGLLIFLPLIGLLLIVSGIRDKNSQLKKNKGAQD
ncbi:DUF3592 domain-containing protein [Geofilum rubicundum]|uniref:DUF3592 domain-containing protein n=1 Tax=Geofilum rubicundum JCM 15548 TaxID=1236989 RepID=A0A0E9LR96_9BACT|nr:DUF3592 domain-containing protein [Geofilum rubicundum]GAO27823.1 hypothetical protein JCM15548_14678 [Geofilum rubicundum JCM 15548]